MSTEEKVVRKGNIPHKVPAEVPVPYLNPKEKPVLIPKPAMVPA